MRRSKPNSKGLLIGLIAGGALLLAICGTGLAGGAIWYFRDKGGSKDIRVPLGKKTYKEAIIGEWQHPGKVQRWEFRSDGKLKRDDFPPLVDVPLHFDLVYTFSAPNVVEIKGDTTGKNRWIDGTLYTQRWEIVRLEGNEMEIRELTPAPDGNTRILKLR